MTRTVLARSGAGTVRLLAFCLLAILLAAAASEPASAARDIFRVGGIEVDATAADAVAARARAIAEGERKGLAHLLRRLTAADAAPALPEIGDLALDRYVRSFEIEDEQVGPTRYLATLAVTYNPAPVLSLLQARGIDAVQRPPAPVLLIPAHATADGGLELWGDQDAWRAVWADPPLADSVLDLVQPVGDLEDISALRAEDVVAGDGLAAAGIAARYAAGEVVVAALSGLDPDAVAPPARLAVDLYTLVPPQPGMPPQAGGGAAPAALEVDVPPGLTLGDALAQVATQVVAHLDNGWKDAHLVRSGRTDKLTVEVPLADLAAWVHIRRGLESLPLVRRVRVDALERGKAALTLEYVGELRQLEDAVSGLGLVLSQESDAWRLLPAGDPRDRATPSPVTGTTL